MQQPTPPPPLALFCVAAPEDTTLLAQWETHLQPLRQANLISIWSELHQTPGTDRAQELQHQFATADLIFLLLSADFFASPDCFALMELALQHSYTNTTRVIPILLRPVAWQESPLDNLTPWPSNGIPITQWSHPDEAWHTCIQELRRLLGRHISLPLPSKPTNKHTDLDWERMLRRLQHTYKTLLDQSLHGIAWVELGLATQPDAVSNATNLLLRLSQKGERLLPPGTSILDAFEEAEEELLILGTPGAGKSTLLLDLAQQLVNRARTDPTHPLPVILRLSSWALGRPALANWMIDQLSQTYNVPRLLSERWVTQGRLLPLLDGLDEMEEAARPACIATINTYHRTHLAPLVVCSRQTEYEAAATHQRLVLQSAVIIQPLSEAQIENYLSVAGPSFSGVQTALHQQQPLRELATTPLMLSVLLLTYRGASAEKIIHQGTELEQQVWTDYVTRQIAEKGNNTRYPLEQTRHWLTYLAQQMRLHQQTIFYAEYLQTDWLPLTQQRTAAWLTIYVPAIILGCLTALLVFFFFIPVWGSDLVLLLQMGLLGGFVGGSLSRNANPKTAIIWRYPLTSKWVSLMSCVLLSVLLAASLGFSLRPAIHTVSMDSSGYLLTDWMRDGSILGIGSGLSAWGFSLLLFRRPIQPIPASSVRSSWHWHLSTWFTTIAPQSIWLAALLLGAGIGLSNGLGFGLSYGLIFGLIGGLSEGLIFGLLVSITVVLVHVILANTIGYLRFAERIHWTWRGLLRPKHLRTSLIVTGATFLFIGLSEGLSVGLSVELSFGLGKGLSNGLSFGLSFGLGKGLSEGLIYWILLGLYQGMKQGHLEDQNRQQFNQGIHRSLHNGLLIGLLSALIISAISVLSEGLSEGLNVGLSNGLNNGLSEGLSSGLSSGLIFGLRTGLTLLLPSIIVMWALSGGLTILRHYVIRWLLARHHTFPWRAQTFLDDATTRILLRRIGGGYSFIHRRLQDYFANADIPHPEK